MIPALVGSVAILLIGTKKKLGTPDHLTIAGMVALAAGWALGVSALEVVVGFLLGALLSAARLIPRLDLVLLNTEVPLRLVLYFFAEQRVFMEGEAKHLVHDLPQAHQQGKS